MTYCTPAGRGAAADAGRKPQEQPEPTKQQVVTSWNVAPVLPMTEQWLSPIPGAGDNGAHLRMAGRESGELVPQYACNRPDVCSNLQPDVIASLCSANRDTRRLRSPSK